MLRESLRLSITSLLFLTPWTSMKVHPWDHLDIHTFPHFTLIGHHCDKDCIQSFDDPLGSSLATPRVVCKSVVIFVGQTSRLSLVWNLLVQPKLTTRWLIPQSAILPTGQVVIVALSKKKKKFRIEGKFPTSSVLIIYQSVDSVSK